MQNRVKKGIPDNIKRDHVIKAIELINREGIPRNRTIKKYYVDYENNQYPCKLLISKANKFANNIELSWSPNIFQSQLANKYLQELGFKVNEL